MTDTAALLASLPTTCTVMPMKPHVAAFLGVNIAIALIMTAVIIGRVYVRVTGPGLAYDDVAALVSFSAAMGLVIIQGLVSSCGGGYPIAEAMANMVFTLRNSLPFQILAMISLSSVKFSMLLLYMRLFPNRTFVKVIYVLFALVGSWTISFIITIIFTCIPIRAQWDFTVVDAVCIDTATMFLALIYSDAAIDLIIMVVPIPVIFGLKMKLSDKLNVLACVLLGLVAVITAFIRAHYVRTMDLRLDVTGSSPPSVFLPVLESILSITCVSIPTLRPLWRRWRGRNGTSTDPNGGSSLGRSRHTHEDSSKAGTASQLGQQHQHQQSNKRNHHDATVNEIEMDEHLDNDSDVRDEFGSEQDLRSSFGGAEKQRIHM